MLENQVCFIKENLVQIKVKFESNFNWKFLDLKSLKFSVFIVDALNNDLLDFRRIRISRNKKDGELLFIVKISKKY